jgi:hypothetical protein
VETLPILPDALLEDWPCVLAAFDGNPTAEVDRLAKMEPEAAARCAQAAQLKSFARRRSDGSVDRFVAFMLPAVPPTGAEGEVVGIEAATLQGDYEWIREYDSQVRYDEKGKGLTFWETIA